MSNFIIRPVAESDAPALAAIYSYYVQETAVSFEYDAPDENEFRNRIAATVKKYPYLVIEDNGEVIGYAYAGAFKTRPAYKYSVETTIYLKNGCQKKGYGKALLAALENELSLRGFTNANACIAYVENEDEYLNHVSFNFHEHMGYRFVGVFKQCAYKFDRWYDMLWMEKHIGEHGHKE